MRLGSLVNYGVLLYVSGVLVCRIFCEIHWLYNVLNNFTKVHPEVMVSGKGKSFDLM